MVRALRADEIELRVGTVRRDGKGFSLLCYKNARCDMNILDEIYGNEWWQRDHKEIKGNLYGGVGVYNKEIGQWIWKWDCGTESFTEKQKGEASDSFKRACFSLGIGRELYTAPSIWIDGHMDNGKPDIRFVSGLRVSLIEYEDVHGARTIKKLQIKDKSGTVVYSYGMGKAETKPKEQSKDELIDHIIAVCDAKRIRVSDLCAKMKITELADAPVERLKKCIEYVSNYRREV